MKDGRIRLEYPDGTGFYLDQETSDRVRALAKERCTSCFEVIRELIKKGWNEILSTNN